MINIKEEEIRKKEKFDKYLQLVEKDIKKNFSNKNKFVKISCPACKSKNCRDEFVKKGFTYKVCNDCQTLFVDPRPSQEALNDFYSNSISTEYWVNDFFRSVEKSRTEKIFKPRVKKLVDYLGKDKEGWTIGDIGAGFGIFLSELKKIWENNRYIAIEPSPEQCKICQGKNLEIICKPLEEITDKDKSFNLLTSFELFEHLYNPSYFLECVNKLLKPGGYFLLTTLNGLGFDIQILKEKSKSVFPPHHLNFFNPNSIAMLLEKNGFEVIDISTPGKLDWDIVENMIKKEKIKIEGFWHLLADKKDPLMKEELQQWISKNNLSSHMQIFSKKK